LIYWSHNDACAQVLGWEHSNRVRKVGLGQTPGKSTSYTFRQGLIFSAPTPRELEMAVEMEHLKTLYKAQNVQLQRQIVQLKEQNAQLQEQINKYAVQQEELATVKRMVAMIMAGKQPKMGNNQEGDVLV